MRVIALLCLVTGCLAKYSANWTSLDTRPLPGWYDEAKIGVFLHWGVFSVPSFGSEWFWSHWKQSNSTPYVNFMEKNYPPDFTYQDFAAQFKAEFFEPEQWADIFNASGARYVVLTTKHHEGYTNWPSSVSWNWNSMDVGPKRDLTGDLAKALRSKQPHIHFGVYHSLYEWFNPLYLQDKANGFRTNDFVTRKTLPELTELVNSYNPDVIWSDGDWEAGDHYWQSKEFLAWLFNDSPVKDTVVVNDRWGVGIPCHHGSFYNCKDAFNPGVLQPHKWENAMPMDKNSWGYRRNARAEDYHSIHDLLKIMAETISCGGNLLVNVGPTKEGTVPALMEERLRQMGKWLDINGEAIYASKPWTVQNDTHTSGVWYTTRDASVYAIVLEWPTQGPLVLGSVSTDQVKAVTMLGDVKSRVLKIAETSDGLSVEFPPMDEVTSDWVWVLKIQMHSKQLSALTAS